MTTKSAITINGTEYIPAREAEVGFLIAIVGIISGIILGFLVLRSFFGVPFMQPIPTTINQPEQSSYIEETIPVESRHMPFYQYIDDTEESQGQVDVTV